MKDLIIDCFAGGERGKNMEIRKDDTGQLRFA